MPRARPAPSSATTSPVSRIPTTSASRPGTHATVVATHIRLAPRVPDPDPHYDDLVSDVTAFLCDRARRAGATGLAPEQIVLDAGLDLGKTPAQSAVLLRETAVHATLGYPLLLSASNKRFVGELLGRELQRPARRIARVGGLRRLGGVPHRARARRARVSARVPYCRGDARRPGAHPGGDVTVHLVQGADPSLRDREVQRVVDERLGAEDRTLALDDHTIASRRKSAGDAGDDVDDDPGGDGASLELPAFSAVTNTLQSPPFMTACRVVVVREVGNLTGDQAKWLAGWIAAPLESTHLILVAGGGRTPVALDKAVKAHGAVVGPASEQTSEVLRDALHDAHLRVAPDAAKEIVNRLGDDAGRVPELVELLHSTYGDGALLDLVEIEQYIGELGTAGRFDLTNALDRGDIAASLEALHRLLTATSAAQPKPLHPMQVMASLVFHYQRLLRLDDPAIVTKEQAASRLGLKSAGGARFPLEAAKRLGTTGLREAFALLARAELDLRGQGGVDERTVMDMLIARLARLARVAREPGRARRAEALVFDSMASARFDQRAAHRGTRGVAMTRKAVRIAAVAVFTAVLGAACSSGNDDATTEAGRHRCRLRHHGEDRGRQGHGARSRSHQSLLEAGHIL